MCPTGKERKTWRTPAIGPFCSNFQRRPRLRVFLALILSLAAPCGFAQQEPATALPDAPDAASLLVSSSDPSTLLQQAQQTPPPNTTPQPPAVGEQTVPNDQQQPKRILGIMPNYRAVSAGQIPPPPTSKEAFKIATQNSFDYSSFAFTGLTSLIAKGTDAHPDLGKGVGGLWAYTWRGFLDKTDGNYLVIWALPTLLHQDERYYAMGHGSKWRRLGYSLLSVPVARDYHGHFEANYSELIGRGAAQAVSTTYYPSADSNFPDLAAKYFYALLRDGATNSFREFWPDISTHVLHRKP
jgi:hypothetical protein